MMRTIPCPACALENEKRLKAGVYPMECDFCHDRGEVREVQGAPEGPVLIADQGLPWPAYNHTREDSELTPCPWCALQAHIATCAPCRKGALAALRDTAGTQEVTCPEALRLWGPAYEFRTKQSDALASLEAQLEAIRTAMARPR